MASDIRRRVVYDRQLYSDAYMFSCFFYEKHILKKYGKLNIAKITNHRTFKMAIIKIKTNQDLTDIYENYW